MNERQVKLRILPKTKSEVSKMKNTLYRIYTEDKNRSDVERLVSDVFTGYTLFDAYGFWEGTKERTLVIEVLTDRAQAIYALAQTIKKFNNQFSVLVVALDAVETYI